MKEIKLKNFRVCDETYIVSLGNGYQFDFKQERKALKFLSNTSQFLTEQLVFINNLYSRLFMTYRQYYLLFKPQKGKQAEIFQAERTITSSFTGIHESLEKAVWMCNTVNGNYIVFSAYYFCINSLRNICQTLNLLSTRQKLTALKYELKGYHNEINQIERSLNEYGQIKAVRMIERARYSDIETINMSKVVS